MWLDKDGDGNISPCEVWHLFAFWEVNPNNRYTLTLQRTSHVMAGMDSNAIDGLSVSLNTTGMHNGLCFVKMTVVEAIDNLGMHRTTAHLNKALPYAVMISEPNLTPNSMVITWSTSPDKDFHSYSLYTSRSSGTLWEANYTTGGKAAATAVPPEGMQGLKWQFGLHQEMLDQDPQPYED